MSSSDRGHAKKSINPSDWWIRPLDTRLYNTTSGRYRIFLKGNSDLNLNLGLDRCAHGGNSHKSPLLFHQLSIVLTLPSAFQSFPSALIDKVDKGSLIRIPGMYPSIQDLHFDGDLLDWLPAVDKVDYTAAAASLKDKASHTLYTLIKASQISIKRRSLNSFRLHRIPPEQNNMTIPESRPKKRTSKISPPIGKESNLWSTSTKDYLNRAHHQSFRSSSLNNMCR